MSAENDLGIPEYARPGLKSLEKLFVKNPVFSGNSNLTPEEKIKQMNLRNMLNQNIFMSEEQHNLLKMLSRKEFHNCCSNPICTGYHGKDQETICPKCHSNLFKLI